MADKEQAEELKTNAEKKNSGVWRVLDWILTALIIVDGLAIILMGVLIYTQLQSSGLHVRDILSRHNEAETVAEETDLPGVESEDASVSTEGDAPEGDADVIDMTEEAETDDGLTRVTITAAGDCTLGNAQVQSYDSSFDWYYDNKGADYFLANARSYFEDDDLTLINLEGTLTDSTARVEKQYNMKGRPEYTSIMTGSSVEFCSLGNNHTYDYGEEGLSDTKAALVSAGIRYAYNSDSCVYETGEGIKIGIVSVSLVSMGVDRENTLFDEVAKMTADPGIKLIIACTHWGEERVYTANSYQVGIAHRLIDAGVDLIIGNHSHVLQNLEVYKGKVIVYSLGNFCFGGNKNPSDKNTAIYRQTFAFNDGVLTDDIDARIVPFILSSHDSYNDFCPREANDSEKAAIIQKLKTDGASYSDMTIDDDGRISG